MIIHETRIPGTYLVDIEAAEDERGFFARLWCAETAATLGLVPHFAQISLSFNPKVGTLRGMHYQTAPHEEAKLVRCTAGTIYDVALDLRRNSPTFRHWFAAELSAANRRMLYIPRGVAHGFLTLASNAEVLYHISEPCRPEMSLGVRWDDPAFAIEWPQKPGTVSARDSSYPDIQLLCESL